jgi:hypothetical protein
MQNQIIAHIERNGMMSWLQSGFRSNHSTTTALLKITNDHCFWLQTRNLCLYSYCWTSRKLSTDGSSAPLLETVTPVQILYQRCWPYKVLSLQPNAMGLDWKSSIRDPASHIRCRTGFSVRPTAFFLIHQRYHERYCIMSVSPVLQTTYNFTSAAVLQIMLIVSVDLTSTLTIYYSGHCETASQSTRPNLRPWWLILDFYN